MMATHDMRDIADTQDSEAPETGPQPVAAPGQLPMVALIGRANVGKSTLFNRLLREQRSLVEDRPGVTRDRVAAPCRVEGRDILLVDTGGLDPQAEEGIPHAVAQQVKRVLEDAAVVLFVVDGREGLLPHDRTIADLLRRAGNSLVLVVNKCDGPGHDATSGEFHALGFDEIIPVSAEHRRGMRDLEISIAERLPPPAPSAPASEQVKIALVGRPNVGKSSLLNKLLGEEHGIVSDVPGTTRDATDTLLPLDGRDAVLIDTAGMRRQARRTDRLERGTAYMSLRAVERADVVVLLLDATEGVTDQDAKIARLALDRGRSLILALNKWDAIDPGEQRQELMRQLERKLRFVRDPVILEISAKTGKGVHRVIPRAFELADQSRLEVSTSELNRALQEAVERYAPPLRGKRRARFFYCTQVANRPPTVLVFMNDPEILPANYRKYLEKFFRERFGLHSGALRLRLRARRETDEDSRSRG
jgi:GTPase